MTRQRLYINVDHIATLRQARRGSFPDPVEGALLCERVGVDGITAHLREDRRHIQDDDIERLATSVGGTLTGKGGDYIIIDDPIKAEDAYSDVARKRVKEW